MRVAETLDDFQDNNDLETLEDIISSKIGVIIPPPEIKAIVDKTANFVAKNGLEFEERIRRNEISNSKFNFLNPNDPYYSYFKNKIFEITNPTSIVKKEFKNDKEPKIPLGEEELVIPLYGKALLEYRLNNITMGKSYDYLVHLTKEKLNNFNIPVKDLPKPFGFLLKHPQIHQMDADVIKITAQFVAKNGRTFLNNLMQREQRNFFFDFLKPQHNLYPYFLALVDQYSKVLVPMPSMLNDIKDSIINNQAMLVKRIQYRCVFEKQRLDEKDKEHMEAEQDKVEFAQIDWHDFVVVETIHLLDDEKESLPPPVPFERLGERILAQEHYEALKQNSKVETVIGNNATINDVQDSEPLLEETESQSVAEVAVKRMQEGNVNDSISLKKSTDDHPLTTSQAKLVVSPLTGELIPADKLADHMRINLLDPRWKEQKQRLEEEKKHVQETFTTGSTVTNYLKNIAEKRTDIFGSNINDRKILESDNKSINIKDLVNKASSVNEYIKETDKFKSPAGTKENELSVKTASNIIGYDHVPGSVLSNPSSDFVNMLGGSSQLGLPAPIPHITSTRYTNPLEANLMHEGLYLASLTKHDVMLRVLVPETVNKNDWKMNGQYELISVHLTQTVLQLKQQIAELTNIPVSKQKLLVSQSLFMKEANTLAYYNLSDSSFISVQLKERGGKNK